MTDVNDWNRKIIDEFRANDGRVGKPFENTPLLLLHTVGSRSGAARVNPLAYRTHDDAFVVFGSFAGSPTHPAWFHNLRVAPDVDVEVGTATIPVRARVTEGAEREEIWSAQKREAPAFAEYEEKAGRQIPVVVLERR